MINEEIECLTDEGCKFLIDYMLSSIGLSLRVRESFSIFPPIMIVVKHIENYMTAMRCKTINDSYDTFISYKDVLKTLVATTAFMTETINNIAIGNANVSPINVSPIIINNIYYGIESIEELKIKIDLIK